MRIRVKHIVVGVAVVAFVLSALKGTRRWNTCRERAAHFGAVERMSLEAESRGDVTAGQKVTLKRLAEVAQSKKRASEYAAFCPWVPLPEPFSVSPASESRRPAGKAGVSDTKKHKLSVGNSE